MIIQVLPCPYCPESDIIKHGPSPEASNAIGAGRASKGMDGLFCRSSIGP